MDDVIRPFATEQEAYDYLTHLKYIAKAGDKITIKRSQEWDIKVLHHETVDRDGQFWAIRKPYEPIPTEPGGNPIPEELDLARTLAIIDSRPKGKIIESKLREEFGNAVIDALRQGHYVVSGSAGYNPPLLVSLKGRELMQEGNPKTVESWTCPKCGRINKYYPYPTRCSRCGYFHTPEAVETIDLTKGSMIEIPLDESGRAIPPEEEEGGNPMTPDEIDQVASKVAAKVLNEVSPGVLDPAGRGMLLHFTEHEIEGAGLVVNEARAKASPCNCFTYNKREYCFSPGVIGMMSSAENPEQITEYCEAGKTYEVKPGIKERFESFAEAAEEAHKKIEKIPKGERLAPWLSTMSEELGKRGLEV